MSDAIRSFLDIYNCCYRYFLMKLLLSFKSAFNHNCNRRQFDFIFQREISLDIPCESSDKQTIQMTYQNLFSVNKMYLVSSRKHAYIMLAPLKPHFYIVKLGFTVVYIIFLISVQKLILWVHVRTASSRRFLRVPTIYDLSRNLKISEFFM